MKTNPETERDDPLLDAMLQDEAWRAVSAVVKAEAMRTFQGRQRIRRLTRWAGSAVVLVAVLAGVAHWTSRPPAVPVRITMSAPIPPKPAATPRRLTDAELVAAFPKGSCFIAEVDGKKELIFFDPQAQRDYLARPGVRGN